MCHFYSKLVDMGIMSYAAQIYNNNLLIKYLHGRRHKLPEVELKEVNHCGQQFLV